ncbi:MAG: hypothetical protein NC548_24415 [Lachnospiraceae bacterium]|nr:hypothetical protein [Lachnospiraceae bacterium]
MNDSIWATVLGIAKTFGVSPDYALHEISFTNALLYSRAVPMPGDEADSADRPLYDDAFDANNPDNFGKFDDDDIDE